MRRLLLTLLLALPAVAAADPIYRCESGGQVVYQDLPCQGEGVRVPLAVPQPSEEEVARARARREQLRAFNREAAEARQAAEAARAEQEEAEREAARDRALDAFLARERQRAEEDEDGERRIFLFPGRPLGIIGGHHRGTSICPLGLSNCKKVGGRGHRQGPPLRHREDGYPHRRPPSDAGPDEGYKAGARD